MTNKIKCITETCEHWRLCSKAYNGEKDVMTYGYNPKPTCIYYDVNMQAWKEAIKHTHTKRIVDEN